MVAQSTVRYSAVATRSVVPGWHPAGTATGMPLPDGNVMCRTVPGVAVGGTTASRCVTPSSSSFVIGFCVRFMVCWATAQNSSTFAGCGENERKVMGLPVIGPHSPQQFSQQPTLLLQQQQ